METNCSSSEVFCDLPLQGLKSDPREGACDSRAPPMHGQCDCAVTASPGAACVPEPLML